jgi:hypothetical protein
MTVEKSDRNIYASSGGYTGLARAPFKRRWAMVAESLTGADTNIAANTTLSESNETAIGIVTGGTVGAGAVGETTGLSVSEGSSTYPVHRTAISLSDVSVTITDGTNAEYGSLELYDFPEGAIQIIGGCVDIMVEVDGESLSATAVGDVHVGTTAQTDVAVGNLETTEDDIVSTAAVSALSDGVGVLEAVDGVGADHLDGTDTAKKAYLNILFDAGSCSDGNDSVTLTGTVTIHWVNVGAYLMSGELPA